MNAITVQQRPKIRSFMDLEAWKEAHTLLLGIYKVTANFPQEEKFRLTDQLCRAAVSVTSNIAEGFSRRTGKEKRQFYRTSLGSLLEIENQILIARDVGYIKQDIHMTLDTQLQKARRMLIGLKRTAENHP